MLQPSVAMMRSESVELTDHASLDAEQSSRVAARSIANMRWSYSKYRTDWAKAGA
ncbi:hypothetical protein [Agrobacterium sp. SORGH_AS 787]|uniref:hypothetical protein n=1 Tax=Agrobacterium sp. SORGH_AS 787 TaxID=3041775 RepID=UPI002780E56A|nr:hypothetical protein [Rhizobium sp. SORGH_AS_0787]